MNRDKVCPHPLVWPDMCGHGDETYIGTTAGRTMSNHPLVCDVYSYTDNCVELVCLRSGPEWCAHQHLSLDLFWSAADAYPPWHPALDLLLSQGFAP